MSKVMEPVVEEPIWNALMTEAVPTSKIDEEESMFIGGEPKPTEPNILSPEDSLRLWAVVRSTEPVVLTPRTREAIANYKRIMSEVVD